MSPLLKQILEAVAITAGGVALFYLLFYAVRQWSKSKRNFFPSLFDKYLHGPGVMLFTIITLNINFILFESYFHEVVAGKIRHGLRVLLIISIGYLLARLINFTYEMILGFYRKRQYNDYTLRSVRTKYLMISRILRMIVVMATIITVLLTFEQLRKFGTTFVASAGMAGIVIGFAAQKSLGTIFAGIQIALTQAVKLDDVVTVENETGCIGEITLTYVVLNTWDEKRLIIPINYFIERPFENWTRNSPEVIGEVKIHTDYSIPVDTIRRSFDGWLKESKLWDRRKASLGISDAQAGTMVLRATMSAKDSNDAGALETLIREKLITFIQEHYPEALPGAARLKKESRKLEKA